MKPTILLLAAVALLGFSSLANDGKATELLDESPQVIGGALGFEDSPTAYSSWPKGEGLSGNRALQRHRAAAEVRPRLGFRLTLR